MIRALEWLGIAFAALLVLSAIVATILIFIAVVTQWRKT